MWLAQKLQSGNSLKNRSLQPILEGCSGESISLGYVERRYCVHIPVPLQLTYLLTAKGDDDTLHEAEGHRCIYRSINRIIYEA